MTQILSYYLRYVAAALAFVVVGGLAYYAYSPQKSVVIMPPGPPMARPLSPIEKAACGYTVETTEGPYYVSGAPLLEKGNLNYTDLPGNRLKVSGHVYEGLDDSKPVANATIDIWQTDADGAYHPNANGDWRDYKTEELALRGTIKTDANGYYEFHTVYPGEYTGRARHIHIKVRAPGKPELTTQLIFALPGDAISFDEDSVSQGLPDCALLTNNAATEPTEATFDFRI